MSLDTKISEIFIEKINEVNPEIFVVEMELHRSKTSVLRILIDKDDGINIDECRHASRLISRYLEEQEEAGNPVFDFRYHLEVGSPGVGNPLKILRQYHQNVGRNLKVKQLEGGVVKGKLIEVHEDYILLEPEASPGKKGQIPSKKELAEPIKIEFDNIAEAKVLVSFK
jgi:ribosome maturation factor RimP